MLNITKAIQSTAILLSSKPIVCIELLRMLYTADLLALISMGKTITGDCYLCTEQGIVPKSIYQLVKREVVDDSFLIWSKFITTSEDYIKLISQPGKDSLCEEEEIILMDTYYLFKDINNLLPKPFIPTFIGNVITAEQLLDYLDVNFFDRNYIKETLNMESYLDTMLS